MVAVKAQPPFKKIANSIRAAILTGEFEPGEQLPPGRELAEFFGVAPMTVHQAVRTLRDGGFVTGRAGSGVFVSKQPAAPENDHREHPLSGLGDFLHEMGQLKRLPRAGWQFAGVPDPESSPSTRSASPSSALPYRYPPGTRDPASAPGPSDLSITGIRNYAAAVDAGNAYVAGETTVDGTPAYRVVQKGPEERPADTQTWLVSKDPANPQLLEILRPCPPASGPCKATTFHTYEITRDRAGLRFPDHTDARVVDVPPPTAKTPERNGSPRA